MSELSKQCQKTLKTHRSFCGSVAVIWILGMTAVFALGPMSMANGTAPVDMTCQLAEDIAEAAETRSIYLSGERDKVSGIVEKTTLAAEINALLDLREQALRWQRENCKRRERGLS